MAHDMFPVIRHSQLREENYAPKPLRAKMTSYKGFKGIEHI